MKKINRSTIAVLMASLAMALTLSLIVLSYSVSAKGLGRSAKSLSPAGNTVEIKLEGKRFIPVEATMNDGDTIHICNADTIYHSLFSYSKYNQFGKPTGVRLPPGECMTRVVHNPTTQTISVAIFDELHAYEKLTLTVLPSGSARGLSGSWRIEQTNSNGAKYKGTLSISQSGSQLSGRALWENHTQGSISGEVTGGTIKFSVQYEGGLVGSYKAELSSEGSQMLNGEARSNKSEGVARWQATRQ